MIESLNELSIKYNYSMIERPWDIYWYKLKNQKYHTVGTVPKSYRKIVTEDPGM
jgi:hypothetical protein